MESKQVGQTGTTDEAGSGRMTLDERLARVERILPKIRASIRHRHTKYADAEPVTHPEMAGYEFAVSLLETFNTSIERLSNSPAYAHDKPVNRCDASSSIMQLVCHLLDAAAEFDIEYDENQEGICKCVAPPADPPIPEDEKAAMLEKLRGLFPGYTIVTTEEAAAVGVANAVARARGEKPS